MDCLGARSSIPITCIAGPLWTSASCVTVTSNSKGRCEDKTRWLLFSCSVMSDSLRPHELQHTRLPHPPPSSRACSNSCPLSQWCHPTISSSVLSFSCLQSFPASGSFPESALLIRRPKHWASASASLLPMNIPDWFPLGWTGLISLQSKGLKSLLQHHSSKASVLSCSAFFMVHLSHPYMTTGKTTALTRWTFVGKVMSQLFNKLSRLVVTFLPRSKCLNFMVAVTICSDFGAPQNKVCHCFPSFLPWSDWWTRCHDLHFLNVEF